jgi:hypothetical protein
MNRCSFSLDISTLLWSNANSLSISRHRLIEAKIRGARHAALSLPPADRLSSDERAPKMSKKEWNFLEPSAENRSNQTTTVQTELGDSVTSLRHHL